LFQHLVIELIVISIVWFFDPAFAGENTPSLELDTVTVTAQKREENLQDVPISISVFDEFDVEDRQMDTIQDVFTATPNLLFFQAGNQGTGTPVTRGISGDLMSLSSATALFIDGVPYLNTVGYDVALVDIERIEVLRGPQSTLYGKNAEAGVINVITRQPDNNFGCTISTELGEDNKRQFSVNARPPLIKDKLYLGLSGRQYEKDGTNLFDETHHSIGYAGYYTIPEEGREIGTKLVFRF